MKVAPRYLLSGRGRVGGDWIVHHMSAAIPTTRTRSTINPTIETL